MLGSSVEAGIRMVVLGVLDAGALFVSLIVVVPEHVDLGLQTVGLRFALDTGHELVNLGIGMESLLFLQRPFDDDRDIGVGHHSSSLSAARGAAWPIASAAPHRCGRIRSRDPMESEGLGPSTGRR